MAQSMHGTVMLPLQQQRLTQVYFRKEQTARLSWLASLTTDEKRSSDADIRHGGPKDSFQLQRHSLVRHAVGALNTAAKNLTGASRPFHSSALLRRLHWIWPRRHLAVRVTANIQGHDL